MTQVSVLRTIERLFGPARDQAERPTCLAFATSDCHAAVRGPWEPLSAEYLYMNAIAREGVSPDLGASVGHTLTSLREDGQPIEAECPYRPVQPWPAPAWAAPPVTEVFRCCAEISRPTFTDVWQIIALGTPVVIGMSLSNAFVTMASDGVIDSNEAVVPGWNHAVVGTGIGEFGTRRFILVRNSWGPGWGRNGYAWLSERYLPPRLLVVAHLKDPI